MGGLLTQPGPDRLGQERPGHHGGAQPGTDEQVAVHLHRGPHQRLADHAAAGGDDQPVKPIGDRSRRRRGDEAGVVHRHPQRGGRLERLLQRRERRVGVHDDRVERGVEPGDRALVVLALAGRALHEDVPQAADDSRPVGAERGHRVQQRHQLELELPPAERVHLDQQHRRPGLVQRRQQQLGPPRAGLLDLVRRVVADQLAVRVVAERRQVEHAHPGRHGGPGREPAAVEQPDVEPLGQTLGQPQRAGQVAEAERMLAVEEQAVAGHGPTPFSSTSSAVSRSSGSRSRVGRCTRFTARTPRSATSAAAVCQRSERSGGSGRTAW